MHHPFKRSKRSRETTDSSSYRANLPSPKSEQRHRGPIQLPSSNFLQFVGFIIAILITGTLYISLSKSASRRTGMSPTPSNTTNFGIGSTRVRSPPPKVIDRTVLHVLHDTHEPNDHHDLSPPTVSRPHLKWPPIVTRIPESKGVSELEHTGAHAPSILTAPAADAVKSDESICGSFPCRFLLPLRIAEQEPKAHLHLHQLAILASSLNRTLVLPNVGNNRIGACSKWPFNSYYDVDLFRSALPAINTLPFTVFNSWSETRPVLPTSRVVSFSVSERDSLPNPLTDDDFTIDYGLADHKVASCLHSKFPRLHQSSSIISFRFYHNNLIRPSMSQRLIQTLSEAVDAVEYFSDELAALRKSDVLAIEWDLRHPIFPEPNIDLQYSHALVEVAERLASFAGPYTAVHWQLERVPVENLAWCAASLVSTLRSVLDDDDSGPQLVWFATDYHTLSEQPSSVKTKSARSGTFQAVKPEHEEAMNIIQDAFQTGGDLEGYVITELPSQIKRLRIFEGNVQFEEEVLEDSGVSGILDKLVSMQSQVFVSGSKACSKTSSSSKQIVDFRESVMRDKEIVLDIRNVVELFGEW
ncbi:uncharacterized protein BJ212DRAFT_908098 [Suillus subaureus]|uniref:O-fucosyltransferase family protein n=1 Tax=Suillus subaureus TaxID=48587 RepID=A0A9P7EGS0_9AGAM|nr:uncharacterized protein BJ212DRAFT_908098 [Suillus subaureus]KAG1821599.1 hypothetical protein BJ212DRAFT_908098 [Suillus subaureus]